ncbi:MAG: 6-carboxytetrahydropterin synthase [Planctomycetota bacterium]|jgi:6-pyruvoyltetrahydropterin/6-carboxytetrahydropterin synthase|nr:6-carboxytetrahydropterin synthase [Planctomycetota bacterium]
MPVQQISYRTEFCAAYRLYREDWSEQRNRDIYGICASPNSHGHNYLFTVTLQGPVDSETGMVYDFLKLKQLVDQRIYDQVDHRNLNLDVPFLQGIVPTSENLLIAFWEQLADAFTDSSAKLYRLRIEESRDCRSDYFGPDHE